MDAGVVLEQLDDIDAATERNAAMTVDSTLDPSHHDGLELHGLGRPHFPS
jgi:hypothetical protein